MRRSFLRYKSVKLALFVLPFLSMLLIFSSFTANKLADEFLKQLGISKEGADEKITGSFLGGSIDIYGVKNAKNILLGNRKAITLDLLNYTKKFANSQSFIKKY